MSTIHVRCPVTGRCASTGILTDPETFAALSRAVRWLRCPACGGHHSWSSEKVWLTRTFGLGAEIPPLAGGAHAADRKLPMIGRGKRLLI